MFAVTVVGQKLKWLATEVNDSEAKRISGRIKNGNPKSTNYWTLRHLPRICHAACLGLARTHGNSRLIQIFELGIMTAWQATPE